MSARTRKRTERTKELIKKYWPDVSEEELWNRTKNDGFTSVPRTMPLILAIIDDLTKNVPASSTYFELWCRAFDEMYVALNNHDSHAYHAGFDGQRAKLTWKKRIEMLENLGFIRTVEGASGKYSHALIINPHVVLKRLKNNQRAGLTEARYNALLARASEIGASDVDVDPDDTLPTD